MRRSRKLWFGVFGLAAILALSFSLGCGRDEIESFSPWNYGANRPGDTEPPPTVTYPATLPDPRNPPQLTARLPGQSAPPAADKVPALPPLPRSPAPGFGETSPRGR